MTDAQVARFWSKVRKSDGCWRWLGQTDKDGYGNMTCRFPGGRIYGRTHRIVWKLAHGSIPRDLLVLHTCDNPPCVNPEHLYLGTHLENVRDRVLRNRQTNLGRHGNHARGENHGRAKLTNDQARTIKSRLSQGESPGSLAKEFGISCAAVWQIRQGNNWKII